MHSDIQLIRKIRKRNDRDSANELIRRYYDEIYVYVYKQLQDKDMAMDVTQDIFIAVIKGLKTFDLKKASFRTWLYRISSNKITDFYRSRFYRQHVSEEEITSVVYPFATGDDESFIEKIIMKEAIQIAMNRITGYRDSWVKIFQMKIFEELTFKEIAEQLKLSENTVKSRYYTMIKQLRKELGEFDEK